MLEDRDYIRQPRLRLRWPVTIGVLAINILVFLLQKTVLSDDHQFYLALSLEGFQHGYVWQLLTYQFLHGGLLHLFLNCWALFIFGREVEWTLGRARFLILYFSSGVVGGLFQLFVSWLWPNYFGGLAVGASAGVFGVVAAFAIFFPDRLLIMLLFFVIPVKMRARSLLWFSLVITAAGIAFPVVLGGNIAHAAHLGGILTGLAFARFYAAALRG